MRFSDIMRDRRGFVHKKIFGGITGAIGGFLGGGPLGGFLGGVGGFLGGGKQSPVPGVMPAPTQQPRSGRPQPVQSTSLFSSFGRPPVRQPSITPLAVHDPLSQDCPLPFMTWDPVRGKCVVDFDPRPGPHRGGPFGDPTRGAGLVEPTAVCVETLVCPTFADNKKGVLWMNALTGDVLCLPRGVNGSGFGLVRKNRPRRKAFVTAAEISALRGQARTKKKAKKFASLTGQVCVTRGSRAQSSRH